MRLILVAILIFCAVPSEAFERFPLSRRVSLSEREHTKKASTAPVDHVWKLGLIGLAAFGFLIRKRL